MTATTRRTKFPYRRLGPAIDALEQAGIPFAAPIRWRTDTTRYPDVFLALPGAVAMLILVAGVDRAARGLLRSFLAIPTIGSLRTTMQDGSECCSLGAVLYQDGCPSQWTWPTPPVAFDVLIDSSDEITIDQHGSLLLRSFDCIIGANDFQLLDSARIMPWIEQWEQGIAIYQRHLSHLATPEVAAADAAEAGTAP